MATNQHETYLRARDNPFFSGMRRGEAAMMEKGSAAIINGKVTSCILRSTSDIGSMRSRKTVGEVPESPTYSPLKDSESDIILEPLDWSSSGRWLRIPEPTSSPLPDLHSDLKFNFEGAIQSPKESFAEPCEANEECQTLTVFRKPILERSYTVKKRITILPKVPLPPSAALFYNGPSPQVEVVESCESIYRLNMYLKARKQDVKAGVPGKFLHAVIGPDIFDVGSVTSTIMYAFYLNQTIQCNQFCTVPIINAKRADLDSHSEVKWLLDSCHVDQTSLLFFDEIDLSYYDLFGSLKLVLVNCSKLPAKQEALKEALVEIFNCQKLENAYPCVEKATLGEEDEGQLVIGLLPNLEASCCTLIVGKFVHTSPEILAGQGFSRLLLAGILLDSRNLRKPQTTSKDKYMATLLINGSGRFGCDGLYQILRYKMHDISDLKVREILRKDLKKWTRIAWEAISQLMVGTTYIPLLKEALSGFAARSAGHPKEAEHLLVSVASLSILISRVWNSLREQEPCHGFLKLLSIKSKLDSNSRLPVSNIGMSSIGISVTELLSLDSTAVAEIVNFQCLEKLSLLMIVSGYYDTERNFKREILISAESAELLKKLTQFMSSSAPELPLRVLHLPDLRHDMRAFETDRVTSRKTIKRLLEEFIELSK